MVKTTESYKLGVAELMVGRLAVRTSVIDVPGFLAAGPDVELEAQ